MRLVDSFRWRQGSFALRGEVLLPTAAKVTKNAAQGQRPLRTPRAYSSSRSLALALFWAGQTEKEAQRRGNGFGLYFIGDRLF